jgi:23S rRNA pseudouridine1911/1915/1917 synthase
LVAAGEPIELLVPAESNGARLDRFIAAATGISRSELQRWIESGHVTVEGVSRPAGTRLQHGARVVLRPQGPALSAAAPDASVTFSVLHVDREVIVVMKPAGLVVHPSPGHSDGTLVNGLLALGLFRSEEVLDPSDAQGHVRPGIVHRLDKGTSGVMVVARTAAAREALKAQFQVHSIERVYEAIVVGRAAAGTFATLHGRSPHDRVRFTGRVATGKRAVTHLRPLATFAAATHVECTLETGRTHQIRVHLSESGTPVLGDPLYGGSVRDPVVRAVGLRLGHQALHARVLAFDHPRTGTRHRFEASPPADFGEALAALSAI